MITHALLVVSWILANTAATAPEPPEQPTHSEPNVEHRTVTIGFYLNDEERDPSSCQFTLMAADTIVRPLSSSGSMFTYDVPAGDQQCALNCEGHLAMFPLSWDLRQADTTLVLSVYTKLGLIEQDRDRGLPTERDRVQAPLHYDTVVGHYEARFRLHDWWLRWPRSVRSAVREVSVLTEAPKATSGDGLINLVTWVR